MAHLCGPASSKNHCIFMLLRCFSFYFGASLSSGGGRIGTSILSRMVGVGDFDNGDIALLLGGPH